MPATQSQDLDDRIPDTAGITSAAFAITQQPTHSHVWKLQACGHPSLTRFEVVRLSPSQPETSVRDLVLLVRRCGSGPAGVDLRKIRSGSRVDFR
jgi:hypothetical protein